MSVAIDTLEYARRLREAGFSQQQAEGQAAALAAAMTDTLATKQDLRELEARVDARFAAVDGRFANVELLFGELEKRIAIRFEHQCAHFDAKLTSLEQRMTLRLGGITVAGIGVVSALLKLT
jgi:hypothetical protein